MKKIYLPSKRGTCLRKNGSRELIISINQKVLKDIFLINGTSFITEKILPSDLIIKAKNHYMIINNRKEAIEIRYSQDASKHEIIYDPYKYEHSKKINLKPEILKKIYNIPEGYIDTLPKWYSFKFTYPEYNLIFIRPELGISIQTHEYRNEFWEILNGYPIVMNGNFVHYFVNKGTKFQNQINRYHSVINPNHAPNDFIILKESWTGRFDEKDIKRVFNPNHYE